MFNKLFLVVWASLSVFHLTEDIFWALIGRHTTISMFIILAGIIGWSFLCAVAVHLKPIKKYWRGHG